MKLRSICAGAFSTEQRTFGQGVAVVVFGLALFFVALLLPSVFSRLKQLSRIEYVPCKVVSKELSVSSCCQQRYCARCVRGLIAVCSCHSTCACCSFRDPPCDVRMQNQTGGFCCSDRSCCLQKGKCDSFCALRCYVYCTPCYSAEIKACCRACALPPGSDTHIGRVRAGVAAGRRAARCAVDRVRGRHALCVPRARPLHREWHHGLHTPDCGPVCRLVLRAARRSLGGACGAARGHRAGRTRASLHRAGAKLRARCSHIALKSGGSA